MTVNALSEPVKLTATMSPLQKDRTLNDHFRKTAKGGIVSVSWGIHMLGRAEVDTIMKKLGATEGDRSIHWEIYYYNKEFDDMSVDSTSGPSLRTFAAKANLATH